MPLFKDKAKKLMADMRHGRNRGTCRFVDPTSAEDENFIAHVQGVIGVEPNQTPQNYSDRFKSQDANNNTKGPDKFANLVQQLLHETKASRDKSLVGGFQQMSLGSPAEKVIRSEPMFNIPPEAAISSFNEKWRAGRERSGSSGSARGFTSHPGKAVNDFHLLKTIGKGAFGKVLLVQCRLSGNFHAMKVLNKKSVISSDNVKGVLNEKRVMDCVSHPFLVPLHDFFKDAVNLYMIMEFVGGGDLFFHLRRKHAFNEKEAQFYGGQIVLALEYLHSLNVIYRDLKPENILINFDGYIKLTDFGLAKRLSSQGTTRSMVGTAEYLAPEIFLQQPYAKSADWWAFGILLYEMVHGKSPFRSESDALTFENILNGKVKFGQATRI